MKYLFLILLSLNAYAKDFAIVLNGNIVHKYESEQVKIFGGPWGSEEALHLEIPVGLDHGYLALENGAIVQRAKTQEEIDREAQEALENAIELKRQRMSCGQRVIALFSVRNDAKDLSTAQVQTLSENYAQVQSLLLNGSLATARMIINSISPDGLLTTQDDKEALINELDSCP
jgi:hypothetical protein